MTSVHIKLRQICLKNLDCSLHEKRHTMIVLQTAARIEKAELLAIANKGSKHEEGKIVALQRQERS